MLAFRYACGEIQQGHRVEIPGDYVGSLEDVPIAIAHCSHDIDCPVVEEMGMTDG